MSDDPQTALLGFRGPKPERPHPDPFRGVRDRRPRDPLPIPLRIVLGAVVLFGLFQIVALPFRAVSSIAEWWDPTIYISDATRAVLTDDEIAIMERMPEDMRTRADRTPHGQQSTFIAAWRSAQTAHCPHGTDTVRSGDYYGFRSCKSRAQAELEGWAFDQIVRDR